MAIRHCGKTAPRTIDMLNSDQINSVVRWLMTTLGTFLVSKGVVSVDQSASLLADVMTFIGAALPLAALIWSFFHHAKPAVPPTPTPLPIPKSHKPPQDKF